MSDDGKSHDPPYVAVASPSAARNSSSGPDRNSDTPFGDPSQPVSLRKLFSYADSFDLMLILVGTLASLVAGVAQPIQIILLGDVVNSFNPTNPVTKEKFRADINSVSLQFAIAGVVMIACGFIQATAWSMTASRQVKRIREAFARAILAKDIGWYDVNDPMKLSTKMVESSFLIEGGMGTKIGDGLNNIALAVSGIIIGLVKGWKLALVVLAATPILAIAAGISVKMIGRATKLSVESYAEAGAIAQESLSNIRTVHMFNAFEHFLGKYKAALVPATKAGIFKGLASGLGSGFMFFTSFCTYAGGLYYGAVLIANDRRDGCVEDCFNGGRVLTIFYCVMLGSLGFGHAAPSLQALGSARVAAADVFAVIDEPSKIDTLNDDGVVPDSVRGYIRFQNVSFAYPSRPKVMVCRNYSLDIQPGKTVALVGPSGSGKSTVVALIERFYNPKDGSVTLDGVDIRTLNLRWLRRQIGLVAQEPTLFATTIMENIRYGKPGATDDEVIEAAKMANAYSFIQDFPQGFLTDVGQRGTQLSGGQKQRIAIARAIIKNPPIMILDEATSALDVESEAVVQESLDRLVLTSKRTTIIIAHRLSTIRYANKIAVHSAGAIVELGTHEQLMKINGGHYRQLVEGQHSSKHCDTKEDTTSSCDTLDHTDSADLMNEATTHSDTRGENANANENHDNNPPALSIGRVWAMSLEDWRFMLLGCIGAILNACTFPVWGFLLTKMTVLFFEEIPRDDFLHKATNWSLGFFVLALVFGCSSVAQQYGFAVTAQKLIARVRSAVYAAMLRQEVGWFDKEENSPSGLVSRLAVDSALVHATTSDILNRLLVVVTTLAITFGISFFHSWEMTLVVLATGPVLIIVGKVRAEVMNGTQGDQKSRDSDASLGATLGEAITSIRTVVSYCLEDEIRSKYHTLLHANQSAERLRAIVGGVTFGISIGARFFVLALLFYVGGIWVAGGRITFEDMFMVIFVIMLGMFAVSMTSQGAQDPTKAKHAASRLFAIIDRTPTIDAASSTGIQLDQVVGDIVFHDVAFSYPTRPNAPIYTQYNLRVKAGQTVALVGASGSGKSTAIALLERFYDPSAGVITLDGHDLRSLSLPWLRGSVSLVSQEPVLFSGSIADNIALGNAGASREEVIEAAKKANAFDFINNFPDGFDTGIGSDGSQVSGGQKQRIAIARAILRDPSVLLLDEATSALDNESERVVQASLDELLATRRRTTIIVAHRLSTIRNADQIAVTQNGVIIEQGTHSELMSIDEGIYKALVMRQM